MNKICALTLRVLGREKTEQLFPLEPARALDAQPQALAGGPKGEESLADLRRFAGLNRAEAVRLDAPLSELTAEVRPLSKGKSRDLIATPRR